MKKRGDTEVSDWLINRKRRKDSISKILDTVENCDSGVLGGFAPPIPLLLRVC